MVATNRKTEITKSSFAQDSIQARTNGDDDDDCCCCCYCCTWLWLQHHEQSHREREREGQSGPKKRPELLASRARTNGGCIIYLRLVVAIANKKRSREQRERSQSNHKSYFPSLLFARNSFNSPRSSFDRVFATTTTTTAAPSTASGRYHTLRYIRHDATQGRTQRSEARRDKKKTRRGKKKVKKKQTPTRYDTFQ